MIIEVTPAQNCWYLVDIDLVEEKILLSCDFTITTEDQLLHSISLFKKLAGLPESYHISIVDENRAMLAILTPKCKLLASGVHHPNDVNEIKKRIIKNYEKTN